MSKRNRDLANSNKNAMEDLINYGVKSKKEYILKSIIPERFSASHLKRKYWIHDLEFYNTTYNCLGLNISNLIGTSKMPLAKAYRSLYREIINLTNEQSGGIGFINFDGDMSNYIYLESDEDILEQTKEFLHDLNVYVRKGCEKAYVTFNFGLDITKNGRRISTLLLKAYEQGDLNGNPFVFPNLVFKLKLGINSDINDINFDIFEKACKVTSKNMVPTYLNCDCSINRHVDSSKIGIMGCRTRVVDNLFSDSTSIKRGNIACITINLVQIALESDGNFETFKQILNNTMLECKDVLLHRFETLCSNDFMDYLGQKNLYLDSEKSDNRYMFKNGTLSIGFIGLWDAISILKVEKKLNKEFLLKFNSFAYEIIEFMRENTDLYTKNHSLNFSLIGSAAEGVSGNFPDYDKSIYGDKIIDKEYYTNSFHTPVSTSISCFEKISLECDFHKLCNGGSITYIELDDIPYRNSEAIKELILFAKNKDCNYFGINFPLDRCHECRYVGKIEEFCPVCESDKIIKLRRVSGYLAYTDSFAKGKFAELKDRVSNNL